MNTLHGVDRNDLKFTQKCDYKNKMLENKAEKQCEKQTKEVKTPNKMCLIFVFF